VQVIISRTKGYGINYNKSKSNKMTNKEMLDAVEIIHELIMSDSWMNKYQKNKKYLNNVSNLFLIKIGHSKSVRVLWFNKYNIFDILLYISYNIFFL
jgi:hypothetical protein